MGTVDLRFRSILKFRRKWLIAFTLLPTLLLSACGGTSASSSSSGKVYTIAFVPKLVGIPYFTAMYNGMLEAQKRFGHMKIIYEGPTTASVSGQDEYVATLIAQHVNAVGVSANSPTSLCNLVTKAEKEGIVFYASDSDVSCPNNELWVEQARAKDIGYAAVDQMASQIHGSGDVAIISAGSTATNLNTWIGYMKQRLATKYPQLHLLPIQYAGESITTTEQIAARLIASDPNLKGMIGVASTNVPGIAQAVLAAHKVGQIAISGETDPNTIRPYIEDGVVKSVVLWNPVNLGYLTAWGVLQILEHHPFHKYNNVPGLGRIEYVPSRHMLLLGPPLIITKANVNLNF